MRRLVSIALLLFAAGCAAGDSGPRGGGSDDDDDDDGVIGDDDDDDDGSTLPTPTPVPTMPVVVEIGATSETVTLPFEIDVTGNASGGAGIGAVSAANNSGTIALDGVSTAIAFYQKQVWSDFNYTLYQGLAIGPSSLDVVWLYCQGSSLPYIWREGVNGPALDDTAASGTCAGADAMTATSVAFPALTLDVPSTVPGYTIDGDGISLADGETGLVTLGGTTYPFVVFEDVDCTDCGGDGWYELHSLVWDGALERVIFVIFYLDFGYPERVLAAYARSLPDFEDPVGTLELDATWTAQPGVGASVRTSVPRLRP